MATIGKDKDMVGKEEVFKFDLRQQRQLISLVGEDGEEKQYTIRELSGRDMEQYLDENSTRIKTEIVDGKMRAISVEGYKGMYTSLLQHSLYDSEDKKVPRAKIDEFPHSVQKGLFEKAQAINDMLTNEADDDDGEEGNSLAGNGSGTD